MNKPSVWRPGGRNGGRSGSGRKPLRATGPSVWRQRNDSRPAAPAEAPVRKREKRHYAIEITEAWCNNCGICSAFCPTGALEDAGHGDPRIADMDLCNGCQLCVVRCPDFAVAVTQRGNDDGRADE